MTTFGMVEIQVDLLVDSELEHAPRVLAAIFNPPETGAEILRILTPFAKALKSFCAEQDPGKVPTPDTPQPGDEILQFPGTTRGDA